MAKQLIHLGTQVVLNFTVADEDGNAVMPSVVGPNGQPQTFFPRVLDVSRLDHAAFEELEAVVNREIAGWKAAFCADTVLPEAATPPVAPEAPAVEAAEASAANQPPQQ